MGAGTEQSTRASHDNAPPDSRRCDGHQANDAGATSRTYQLEELRAQAKELYQDAFGPHKAANHEELAHRWRAASKEISTLESNFVLYQGQEIEATLVNYLSGTIPTSTVDADGDEELFRDAAGRYYLRRKLGLFADYHEDDGDGNIEASGRTHVHRLSVNAAILWATTRLNSETLALRSDAASLLTRRVPVLMAANDHDEPSLASRYGVSPATFEAAARYATTAGSTLENMVAGLLERAATLAPGSGGEPPVEVQIVGPCQRFTFDYPATAKVCGRQRVLELDVAQMHRATELATVFSLSLPAFLRLLADYNDLPGQPRRTKDKLRDSLAASHVAFVCMDEAMARRIERAASARQQTADEFVAGSVGGDVDMWEECMLLHPTTGDVLEVDYENLYTTIEDQLTTPPLGCEDVPPFGQPSAAMSVRLEAEATTLVRRYLEVTPFDYTAQDIVSGCVIYALDQAFAAQGEAESNGTFDGEDFQDGGWGYVEEEICDARERRVGPAKPAPEAEEAA